VADGLSAIARSLQRNDLYILHDICAWRPPMFTFSIEMRDIV
jgi:hypothetical protein